jgi:hypothetical protein
VTTMAQPMRSLHFRHGTLERAQPKEHE